MSDVSLRGFAWLHHGLCLWSNPLCLEAQITFTDMTFPCALTWVTILGLNACAWKTFNSQAKYICIEHRPTQTQIQQDPNAQCRVLIGADKVLEEACNATDLTLTCQSYLRQQTIMYSDKSHNQNWSKSNHVLKWTPCDGSRHASCINWLTYNVEGHLPQNTSMSHTPTTNRRLAVFTTLELTCKRIQATVHADKQTNAHTHKLEWI